MVKPAQNRRRDDALARGQFMAVRRHRAIRTRLRNSWSQAAMLTAAIVMRDPSGQTLAAMGLTVLHTPVQAPQANAIL